MQKNTQLGNEAKAYISAGKLVPDEVVIGMISQKLDENKTQNPAGYIFDGFPRTVPQAEALDKLLLEKATPISKVLSLIVSDAELIERLSERGKSSGRADDSNVDVIKNRIKVYFDETLPFLIITKSKINCTKYMVREISTLFSMRFVQLLVLKK